MPNLEKKVSKILTPAQKARKVEAQRKARKVKAEQLALAKIRAERSKTLLGRIKNRWDDLTSKMK